MRKIQDRDRSESGIDIQGEIGTFDDASGWGEEAEFNNLNRLIKTANKKVKLIDIFKYYNITVSKSYSNQIWSELITCPLKTHKGGAEKTPSFGYNFINDFFNCFGCGTSGGAVDFLSIQEGKSKRFIAERIIAKYGDIEVLDDIEKPEIDSELFSIANLFRNKIIESKGDSSKIDKVNKIMFWFDMYVSNKAPKDKITIESLKYRKERIQELLKEI